MIEEFKFMLNQTVIVKALRVDGFIDCVMKDSRGAQYGIVFWFNGDRKREFMYEHEIEER